MKRARAGDPRGLERVLAGLDKLCWHTAHKWKRPGVPGMEVEDLYQEARLAVVEVWRKRRMWGVEERLRIAHLAAANWRVAHAASKARAQKRSAVVLSLDVARAGIGDEAGSALRVDLRLEAAFVGADGMADVETAFLLEELWRGASTEERSALEYLAEPGAGRTLAKAMTEIGGGAARWAFACAGAVKARLVRLG